MTQAAPPRHSEFHVGSMGELSLESLAWLGELMEAIGAMAVGVLGVAVSRPKPEEISVYVSFLTPYGVVVPLVRAHRGLFAPEDMTRIIEQGLDRLTESGSNTIMAVYDVRHPGRIGFSRLGAPRSEPSQEEIVAVLGDEQELRWFGHAVFEHYLACSSHIQGEEAS